LHGILVQGTVVYKGLVRPLEHKQSKDLVEFTCFLSYPDNWQLQASNDYIICCIWKNLDTWLSQLLG